MAEPTDETAQSAEKAYAEAAAKVKPVEPTQPKAAPAKTPAVAAPAPVAVKPVVATKTAVPKKPAAASRKIEKPAPIKPAAKTKAALAKAARRAARVARAAAAPAAVKRFEPKLTVTELKEKIMATAKTADFTKPRAAGVGEFQNSAKAAYEKSAEAVTEMTEFTKGNVEAIVESSKIFATGAQSLGKTYVEEAKSAYETLTTDVKEIAAVKSPTELFQLQGKIARRNFDALVATSSKNTEAFLKLANDAFVPLTGRVEIATEKLAKVA
jgi:phasin family protein